MKKRAKLFAVILVFIMVFSLVACSGNTTSGDTTSGDTTSSGETSSSDTSDSANTAAASEDSASTKDTLYVGSTQVLTSFQHGTMLGLNTDMSLVFDFLMYCDGDDGGIWKSNILESWDRPDDETIVLTVKEGITFANGDPLTGEDVLFTVDSYFAKESPFANMLAAFDTANSSVSEDGMTVTLKLSQPWGPGLENMPMPIVSKTWCEQVGWDSQEWYDNPLGSGPYTVEEYVTGDHQVFVRNENYWGDSSAFPYDTIYVKYYSEPSTCFMDLEKGDIDIAVGITNQDYERALEGVDGVEVTKTHAGENTVISFNNALNPVTQDVNIRKALTIAVEWGNVSELQFGSLCTPCDAGFMPQSSPWYDDTIEPYEYDPELAKQLLEEAGYSEGELNFRVQITPDLSDFATGVQYYWSEIGVNLSIETVDFPTLIQTYLGDTDPWLLMFNSGQTSSGEPYAYLQGYLISSKGFVTNWIEDPTFNELGETFLATIGEAREQANHELQQYIRDNYMLIDACDTQYGIAYNPDVIEHVNIMGMMDSFFWWDITFK